MGRLVKSLVIFVIVFHGLVFVAEALFWMQPGIHERVLGRISDSTEVALYEQAVVLRAFLLNQGFYNLFLAIAGVAGLILIGRGKQIAGQTLVGYMCFSAAAAGLVLACTSSAYAGAVLQGLPPAIALALMFRARSEPLGATALPS